MKADVVECASAEVFGEMAIYDQFAVAQGAGGTVVVLCRKCKAVADDATTGVSLLKVCSRCGTPLAEWATTEERDTELKKVKSDFERYTLPPPKRYRIRITSGQHAGRYVGARFGGGYVSNPDVIKNPALNVDGARFALWTQESGAMRFFEGKPEAVQAELNTLGYQSELVEVA
jgi:hypothetical protein